MNPLVRVSRGGLLRVLNGMRVQVATSVGLLELEAEDTAWQPMRQIPMSPAVQRAHASIGMDPADMQTWANDDYEAFVKPLPPEDEAAGGLVGIHLSVKRYDRQPCHNWRHLQQIKNEVIGPEREAVELYPAESRIVDNANQFHLWVLPEDAIFPVGFPAGFFLTDDEIATFNANGDKSRQEPVQPGLTVGRTMLEIREEGGAEPELESAVQQIVRGGMKAR